MRRFFLTLLLFVLLLVGGLLAFIYSGSFNVSARDPHFAPVRWAIETTLHHSVAASAEGIAVPALEGEEMLRQGAQTYAADCALCHGRPGAPLPAMAQNMRPQPPAFAEHVLHWEPAEAFWIVKYGLKMTGMPAWAPLYGDEQIWPLVAFLQRLPELSSQEYEELVAMGGKGSERDGQQAQGGDEAETPAATVEMTAELTFAPAKVTIKAGQTVKWVNFSNVRHTVTADPAKARDPEASVSLPEGAETFDSGFLDAEGTYSRRFTVPGTYRYFCIPHEAAGMVGEIVVEE